MSDLDAFGSCASPSKSVHRRSLGRLAVFSLASFRTRTFTSTSAAVVITPTTYSSCDWSAFKLYLGYYSSQQCMRQNFLRNPSGARWPNDQSQDLQPPLSICSLNTSAARDGGTMPVASTLPVEDRSGSKVTHHTHRTTHVLVPDRQGTKVFSSQHSTASLRNSICILTIQRLPSGWYRLIMCVISRSAASPRNCRSLGAWRRS